MRLRAEDAGAEMKKRKPLPNGARAIMGSRKESKRSREFFPTPPWATRALFEYPLRHLKAYRGKTLIANAFEPACGEGHIAGVLEEYFDNVTASDVIDYGYPSQFVVDFLKGRPAGPPPDWIITNPPFAQAIEFTLRALELARRGIAMFVRVQFLETIGRYERLFRDKPPTLIAFFTERVPIQKGRWKPQGSTATAYCWLIWEKISYGLIHPPYAPFWIPPGCKAAFTKPDDRARFAAWSLPKALEAAE